MKKVILSVLILTALMLTGCEDTPEEKAATLAKQQHEQYMERERLNQKHILEQQRMQVRQENYGAAPTVVHTNNGSGDLVTGMVAGALLNSALSNNGGSSTTRNTTVVNKTYVNKTVTPSATKPSSYNPSYKSTYNPSSSTKASAAAVTKPLKSRTATAKNNYSGSTRAQSFMATKKSTRAASKYKKKRTSYKRKRK